MSSSGKRLVIYGASGHAKVADDVARLTGRHVLAFVESEVTKPRFLGVPVISQAELLAAPPCHDVFVAIGDPAVRQSISQQLCERGFRLTSLVHPSAVVADGVSLGAGTLIAVRAIINPGCAIGRGCIINSGAIVDHDCLLDDFVHIGPGVNLAGSIKIGTGSWIGVGASVRDGVRIGQWTMVGAGAVVVQDLPSDVTAYGVPARVQRYGRHFIQTETDWRIT